MRILCGKFQRPNLKFAIIHYVITRDHIFVTGFAAYTTLAAGEGAKYHTTKMPRLNMRYSYQETSH